MSFSRLKQKIKRRIISKVLQGDNVMCLCCNKNFLTFLPHGNPTRFNVRCPNCGALERHRMIWFFLQRETDLFDATHEISLLHLAPEAQYFEHFVKAPHINYIPGDKFTEKYENAYSTLTRNIDVTEIPLEDQSVDVVLCVHVLEHVLEDRKAIREFFRVLRLGGWAILNVPLDKNREKTYEDFSITDPKEREKHFGQFDHVRWYGRDYKERLEETGFEVQIIDYVNKFSEEEQKQYGLQKGDDIYLCRKPMNALI